MDNHNSAFPHRMLTFSSDRIGPTSTLVSLRAGWIPPLPPLVPQSMRTDSELPCAYRSYTPIYTYIYICRTYTPIYIYIYIEREREREVIPCAYRSTIHLYLGACDLILSLAALLRLPAPSTSPSSSAWREGLYVVGLFV